MSSGQLPALSEQSAPAGRQQADGPAAGQRPRRRTPLAGLTGQERRILDLIGEGLTNRRIGERMFLAEKTVKNYVSGLFQKLGMERRTQAAAYAAHVFDHDASEPRRPPEHQRPPELAITRVTGRYALTSQSPPGVVMGYGCDADLPRLSPPSQRG